MVAAITFFGEEVTLEYVRLKSADTSAAVSYPEEGIACALWIYSHLTAGRPLLYIRGSLSGMVNGGRGQRQIYQCKKLAVTIGSHLGI